MLGWVSSKLASLLLPGAVLIGIAHCAGAIPPSTKAPSPINGFWQDDRQPDYLVGIEDGRVTVAFKGQVRSVASILQASGSRLRLCDDGQEVFQEVSPDGPDLIIHDPRTNEAHRLRRLSTKPRDLTLLPLEIAAPTPVSPERAARIGGELGQWVRADQEAQRPRFDRLWKPSPGQDPETGDFKAMATRSENTARLKQLVQEVGWIDSERFGATAADDAFLLAQHSRDLPLMLAALPWVKKEVESKHLEGEAYALLYDRIQLLLGRKQLYGTRVGKGPSGQPVVMPTLAPDTVEERRSRLGMVPLSEYVKIFGAEKVIFSSACGELTTEH